MMAWQKKCASCRRHRKVYAYQSLTFYCRRCWTHRDSSSSANINLFISEKAQGGFTGPIWELDARPAFAVLR